MFLAAALSPLGSTMIAVALPSIGRELGVPGGALTQWLVASYLIAGIAVMSACGKLGDLIGHRRSLAVGMTIYGVGSALGGVLATLPSLAFARISMAIGGAMTVPAAMAILRNTVPVARRPRAFGWMGSVMGTAAAIGPLLGGELTARFGWRAVFFANVPVILVAFALIRLSGDAPTPAAAQRDGTRFDVGGAVLLAIALTCVAAASRLHGPLAPWGYGAGAALLVAFAVWERRVAAPVMDLGLFAHPAFAAGNAVVALQNLAMYALLFQLPIFFEQVRGARAGSSGRTIVGMMVAMVVFAPIGGRLAERFGARVVAFTGCLASLAGVFLVGDFSRLHGPADALAGLVLVGAGLGLATSPSQSAAMSVIDHRKAGMAAGAMSTSRYLGGIVGISALGALLAGNPGIASHSHAVACYEVALAASAIAALVLPGRADAARDERLAGAIAPQGVE